jgi:uncharacterized protein involved in exopolysaccharide biosynthesis
MAEDKVRITLAHPLTAEHAARIGLDNRDYPVRSKVSVTPEGAQRLIAVGYTTVDPEDPAAVAEALNPAPPASAAPTAEPAIEQPGKASAPKR